jgi:hypothetical protein
MSTLIHIVVLIGIMMALSLGPSRPSQAQLIMIKTGVTQTYTIWQTSPPAFTWDTRWADVGLALLLGRVTLGMSTTVVDFQTIRFSYPPDFDFSVFIKIVRLLGVSLSIGGGAVVTPARNWIAWYLETDLTRPLALNLEDFVGIGIETTQGTPGSFFSPGSPTGTCIYLNIGFSWSLRVL